MMNEQECTSYEHFVAERRERILQDVAASAHKVGRDPSDVLVVAVSKTVGVDEVRLAWEAGYRVFGENRPQELRRKVEAVADLPEMAGVRFDMIGNLQTNKINQVIEHARLVHSVSSDHLAEAMSRRAVNRGLTVPILLEVNVSGEGSKSGFSPDEARASLDKVLGLPGLALEGVMTMAPAHDADAARRTFSGLRELRDELRGRSGLPLETLSCGMSDDFGIAVEEGSTLIRLGRIVFDPAYPLGL